MNVVVVWATTARQDLVSVELEQGATIHDAIEATGLISTSGIDIKTLRVGIHNKLARLDTRVSEGDRIEIYRPLIADAKAMRKARVGKNAPLKTAAARRKKI